MEMKSQFREIKSIFMRSYVMVFNPLPHADAHRHISSIRRWNHCGGKKMLILNNIVFCHNVFNYKYTGSNIYGNPSTSWKIWKWPAVFVRSQLLNACSKVAQFSHNARAFPAVIDVKSMWLILPDKRQKRIIYSSGKTMDVYRIWAWGLQPEYDYQSQPFTTDWELRDWNEDVQL